MKKRKLIKIIFHFFVVFTVFSVTSCKEKMNVKNIFVRIYPSDINDYSGVITVYIENGCIYFQENNFICNQTFLQKRVLKKQEVDSLNLILSQTNFKSINDMENNKYDAEYYYVIDLKSDNKSISTVVFQDVISDDLKLFISFIEKMYKRDSFVNLESEFSNINMNTVHLLDNNNDTITLSSLNSFLLWKNLNINKITFKPIDINADSLRYDYLLPISYNLGCVPKYNCIKIKENKLFIIDNQNKIFQLFEDFYLLDSIFTIRQ